MIRSYTPHTTVLCQWTGQMSIRANGGWGKGGKKTSASTKLTTLKPLVYLSVFRSTNVHWEVHWNVI